MATIALPLAHVSAPVFGGTVLHASRKVEQAMDGVPRGLTECKIDMLAFPCPDTVSAPDAETTGLPSEPCASLYDAIRDMNGYGSRVEAEKRRGEGDGHLRAPREGERRSRRNAVQ
jgi:hypothetical protein